MLRVDLALLCALAFVAAGPSPLAAQEKMCDVVALEDGQLFPVLVRVNQGKDAVNIQFSGNSEKGKPSLLLQLKAGVHIVQTVHYRLGFPQPVIYRTENFEGKRLWESEATVDPRRIELKEGQKLVVLVRRSMESYNAKFFTLRGVHCALVFPRPYWYQDAGPGQFKGTEAFPNSLFFLVSKAWGPKKVFGELADEVVSKFDANPQPLPLGDYRRHHVSCLISLDSSGSLPEALTKLPRKQLKDELQAALLAAFEAMKAEKCYRPFPAADVAALKRAGFLPADTPDGDRIITFAEGLKLAEPALVRWLNEKKEGKK